MKAFLCALLFPIATFSATKPYVEHIDIVDVPGKPGHVQVIVTTPFGEKVLELEKDKLSKDNPDIDVWFDGVIGEE